MSFYKVGYVKIIQFAVLWPPLQQGAIVKYEGCAWKLYKPAVTGKLDAWWCVCLGDTDQAGVHRRAQDTEAANW